MSDGLNVNIGELGTFLQGLAVVGAGLWAYIRYGRERLNHPQVEFTVAARLLGPQRSNNVVETTLTFRNTGKARVELPKIKLEIRGIKHDADLVERQDKPAKLDFTTRVVHEPNLVPPEWEYLFVEPGVTQEIKHVSKVDTVYSFLLVRSEFVYRNGDPHSSVCVVETHARPPAALLSATSSAGT